MHFIKTEKQKDNIAKFSFNVAKIILAVAVIGPIAKPESFNLVRFIGGFVLALMLFVLGALMDIKEVQE